MATSDLDLRSLKLLLPQTRDVQPTGDRRYPSRTSFGIDAKILELSPLFYPVDTGVFHCRPCKEKLGLFNPQNVSSLLTITILGRDF